MTIFGLVILRASAYKAELTERQALGQREGESAGAWAASVIWRGREMAWSNKQAELEAHLALSQARLQAFADAQQKPNPTIKVWPVAMGVDSGVRIEVDNR